MASLQDGANNGSQQSLGAVAQLSRAGAALALHNLTIYVTVPASQIIVLPNDQKAKAIFETLDAADGTAGNATLRPDGDLDTTETAGVELEITYRPWEGAVVAVSLVPDSVTGVAPLSGRNVLLIGATTVDGAVDGAKTVVARTATPATGEAALSGDGLGVDFLPADIAGGATATGFVLLRASLAARLQADFFGQ